MPQRSKRLIWFVNTIILLFFLAFFDKCCILIIICFLFECVMLFRVSVLELNSIFVGIDKSSAKLKQISLGRFQIVLLMRLASLRELLNFLPHCFLSGYVKRENIRISFRWSLVNFWTNSRMKDQKISVTVGFIFLQVLLGTVIGIIKPSAVIPPFTETFW